MEVGYKFNGKYTTDLITDESLPVISKHNTSQPWFLYVAHAAVHSANKYNPLQAPNVVMAKMKHIADNNRKKYAGKFYIRISLYHLVYI